MFVERIKEILNRRPHAAKKSPAPAPFNPKPEMEKDWLEKGYVLFEKLIPETMIDDLVDELAKFRATAPETKDEHGYGSRIGVFHIQSDIARKIALNPTVRSFLNWTFKQEPVLYGSLCFEAGTEQAAHNDAIFFHTEPDHAMAGVWFALEDVHADAGPLFYYPGSHRWHFLRGEEVFERDPENAKIVRNHFEKTGNINVDQSVVDTLGAKWSEMLAEQIEKEKAQRQPAIIRKGDVFIWHAHLVHGGSARVNRKLSRNSMVVHYIGREAALFDMKAFFTLKNDEFSPELANPLTVLESKLGPYVAHEKPVTY